jgi:hypothetical protein
VPLHGAARSARRSNAPPIAAHPEAGDSSALRAWRASPAASSCRARRWLSRRAASRQGARGSFWIDRTEVTNAQFAAFVQATGYVTDAERAGEAVVFHKPTEKSCSSARTRGGRWCAATGVIRQGRHRTMDGK